MIDNAIVTPGDEGGTGVRAKMSRRRPNWRLLRGGARGPRLITAAALLAVIGFAVLGIGTPLLGIKVFSNITCWPVQSLRGGRCSYVGAKQPIGNDVVAASRHGSLHRGAAPRELRPGTRTWEAADRSARYRTTRSCRR
jgi:hypothetical protein